MARGKWAITEGQQAMEGDGGALAAPEDRGDGEAPHGRLQRGSLARGLPGGRLLPRRAIGVGWGRMEWSGKVRGLSFIATATGHGWRPPGHASMAAEGMQQG